MDVNERKRRQEEAYEQWLALSVEHENTIIGIRLLREDTQQDPKQFAHDVQFVVLLKAIARDHEVIATQERKAHGRKKKELAAMQKNYEDWGRFFKNHPLIIPCMSIGEVIATLEAHARALQQRLDALERTAKET